VPHRHGHAQYTNKRPRAECLSCQGSLRHSQTWSTSPNMRRPQALRCPSKRLDHFFSPPSWPPWQQGASRTSPARHRTPERAMAEEEKEMIRYSMTEFHVPPNTTRLAICACNIVTMFTNLRGTKSTGVVEPDEGGELEHVVVRDHVHDERKEALEDAEGAVHDLRIPRGTNNNAMTGGMVVPTARIARIFKSLTMSLWERSTGRGERGSPSTRATACPRWCRWR